jgi:hypothetical protein
MAKIIENAKGFKAIEVSLEEIQEKFGGLGICDSCNAHTPTAIYVPVLNYCLCLRCYDEWSEIAINYPEDLWFEDKMFKLRKEQLEIE